MCSSLSDGQNILREAINDAYAAMGMARQPALTIKPIPDTDELLGKRVTMVDDSPLVISTFIEPLMIATDGNALFVHHDMQNSDVLLQEIADTKPDIVLLDANLEQGMKGYHLISLLKETLPQAEFIGFSTAASMRDNFLQAGAKGFVLKDVTAPEVSLKDVAKLLNEGRKVV